MAGLADGFIALPGGAGTLEEIFEQWTWAQLGIHHKPCGFLNTNGYFDPLREMIGQMTGEGFLRPEHASMLLFDSDPATMLDAFRDYVPPLAKWEAPSTKDEPVRRVIRIVAALVQDEERRVLLVRKTGTRAFMQPGGKLRDSESHLAALERELGEELRCGIRPNSPAFLGMFTAPAANESGCLVEAALYRVELAGPVSAASEIEEIAWVDPGQPQQIELAPLTRETVLPLAARASTTPELDGRSTRDSAALQG
jgi:8-oxo-dGTP pyrophosphatase MutT (NUDIX family)